MDLKELLGEELYNQVIEKTGDNKIAIVSDGNWFPKEKFNEVNNDNKELKKELKQRDEQLETLSVKAKGNEELTNEINTLKEANKTAQEEYDRKLAEFQKESKLDLALKDAKAKNPKAVKALLNNEAIKLDGDTLLGLEEQLKSLKESDGYLFGEEQPPGLKGREPQLPGQQPPSGGKNPFSKEHFNLTEQARLFKEDPEMYKQLKAQA
jgi:hypothetical protein